MRELIQHRVIASIVRVRLEQLLVEVHGAVVATALNGFNIVAQLIRFGGFELKVTKSAHRFSLEVRVIGNQVEKCTIIVTREI